MPPTPACSAALAGYSNSSTVLLDNSNSNKVYVWRATAANFATASADCSALAKWQGDTGHLISYNSYDEVGLCGCDPLPAQPCRALCAAPSYLHVITARNEHPSLQFDAGVRDLMTAAYNPDSVDDLVNCVSAM
jgi:hypothetical protein